MHVQDTMQWCRYSVHVINANAPNQNGKIDASWCFTWHIYVEIATYEDVILLQQSLSVVIIFRVRVCEQKCGPISAEVQWLVPP